MATVRVRTRISTTCVCIKIFKLDGNLSTAMTSLFVPSTMIQILSTQLESPGLAKELEDCRKTCLNVVSVHDSQSHGSLFFNALR
jgi:hypothetical protein